jgi:hypothetical protein
LVQGKLHSPVAFVLRRDYSPGGGSLEHRARD